MKLIRKPFTIGVFCLRAILTQFSGNALPSAVGLLCSSKTSVQMMLESLMSSFSDVVSVFLEAFSEASEDWPDEVALPVVDRGIVSSWALSHTPDYVQEFCHMPRLWSEWSSSHFVIRDFISRTICWPAVACCCWKLAYHSVHRSLFFHYHHHTGFH